MLFWMLIIILLTISMIFAYYIIPDTPEVLMAHAYGILFVSLAVMYRVLRKIRAGKLEKLVEELNRQKLRIAELEGKDQKAESISEESII